MPRIAVFIKAESRYCVSGMTVQNRPEYSVISLLILVEYARLLNGKSKLYLFTRHEDERYIKYMRWWDTKILTDIIDDVGYGYLVNWVAPAGKEADHSDSGQDSYVSPIHNMEQIELSPERLREMQEVIKTAESFESVKNQGRFQKSVQVLNTDVRVIHKTEKQMALYKHIYEELGKIVRFPNEKKASSHIFDAATIVIALLSVTVALINPESTVKNRILFVLIVIFLIWLVAKALTWISSLRTAREDTILYMYGLLEDVVLFGKPIYVIDSVEECWKADRYIDWITLKSKFRNRRKTENEDKKGD